ncbi:cellulose synthase (UDP-forming) OS=Streptomyces microflavus OX=1919 GN=Smic_27030 PE=4 SV=1 [Streptomyces microflavus]
MFVGTSSVVRVAAAAQVGVSATRSPRALATGFEIHTARNPLTRTLLALRLRPRRAGRRRGASWTDFLPRQLRWLRGGRTETLFKQ